MEDLTHNLDHFILIHSWTQYQKATEVDQKSCLKSQWSVNNFKYIKKKKWSQIAGKRYWIFIGKEAGRCPRGGGSLFVASYFFPLICAELLPGFNFTRFIFIDFSTINSGSIHNKRFTVHHEEMQLPTKHYIDLFPDATETAYKSPNEVQWWRTSPL